MIRIRQIKIEVQKYTLNNLKKAIAKKFKIKESEILSIKIMKRSIDARKKPTVFYIFEVDVLLSSEESILQKYQSEDVFLTPIEKYQFPKSGNEALLARPVIVGSGPSGLFCAYFLAQQGYQPIILERGEKVDDRIASVNHFWSTGILNEESNVQFGEGGAGTFSDGKLNTMVKDKLHRGKKVLEIFIECGANPEILYDSHPHIGTDKLCEIIKKMREKIISMGGSFYFQHKLTDIETKNNCLKRICVNGKWMSTDILVLAIGHSARDTFEMLYQKGLFMKSKPFAVGLRIMHSQAMINDAMFGSTSKYLPPANYKLTYTTKEGRGVYSFCMCPGGYVVNASSEKNRLAINGMSESNRDTTTANSAMIVTVSSKDFGENPLDGIYFQRVLEQKAFNLGNGNIPIQLYKDFKENRVSSHFGNIDLITKGKCTFANLNELFPAFIGDSLKEAIDYFDSKIKGFSADDTILLGVESRTSSPVRIERDNNGVSNILGIYPCGEGAGYAGGITSSAMDGIKIAEEIAKKYSSHEK